MTKIYLHNELRAVLISIISLYIYPSVYLAELICLSAAACMTKILVPTVLRSTPWIVFFLFCCLNGRFLRQILPPASNARLVTANNNSFAS